MKKTAKHLAEGAAEGSVSHYRQLPRLARIEGQVRGLRRMIEAERDCLDIVHQISAAAAALRRVQSDILRDHFAALAETIITAPISTKKRRELADVISARLKHLP